MRYYEYFKMLSYILKHLNSLIWDILLFFHSGRLTVTVKLFACYRSVLLKAIISILSALRIDNAIARDKQWTVDCVNNEIYFGSVIGK